MADSHDRRWAFVTFCFAAVTGLLLQARGALFPSFQTTFGVTESQLGLIAPLAAVASFLTVLSVGMRAGDLDIERTFRLALYGLVAALFLLWWSPTFALLLAFVVVRMVTTGVARALDRPILSHLFPTTRSRLFSLYEMSWAVGATAGPLLVTAALWLGDWRLTYLVAAVAVAALALAVTALPTPADVSSEQSLSLSDLRGLLDHSVVRTMALALALSVAVESSIFTWLPFYAAGFLDRSTANLMLSIYLVAYVPGRFVASRVVDRIGPQSALLASAVGVLPALVATLSLRRAIQLGVSVFVLGFFIAVFFPTVLSWATGAVPGFSGPVNAIANASATVGAFVSPALVGVLADATDITLAMWVLPAFAFGLLVLAAVRWLVDRSTPAV